jgi:tetratricopeptide (TPR) repeat protein
VSDVTGTEPTVVERARRHVNASEYAAAVAMLGPHLRRNPGDVDALNVLGLATFQLGKLDAALAAYREMWSIVPTDVRALFGTGMTLQKLGILDEAEAWFAATLAIDPDFERAARRLVELPALRAAAPSGAAAGPSKGRRPMTSLILPEDEDELETYRRTSRERARIDIMNQYWYGIPWPVRALQMIVLVVIVAGVVGTLGR